MLTPRAKPPLPQKFSSEQDQTHNAASCRTASPTHYQRAIPAPHSRYERNCKIVKKVLFGSFCDATLTAGWADQQTQQTTQKQIHVLLTWIKTTAGVILHCATHTQTAYTDKQHTHISRVSNQNGISRLFIIAETYHSGRKPSIYKNTHLEHVLHQVPS